MIIIQIDEETGEAEVIDTDDDSETNHENEGDTEEPETKAVAPDGQLTSNLY